MSVGAARRTVGLAFAVCLAWPAVTRAEETAAAAVVVGTGDPARDVAAVQAAVDQGGIVVLRGTFDFGSHAGNHVIVPGRPGAAQDERGRSTVFVYRRDVVIVGQTDAGGRPLTTIRRGMPPFWIGWDGEVSRTLPAGTANVDFGIESLPVDAAGRVNYRDTGPEPGYEGPQTRYAAAHPLVSAKIQHLVFAGPLHYAIKATAGRDIAVLDNVIRDVGWGGLVHLNGFAAATHIAGGFIALGQFYAPFLSPSVTGSVVAAGNRIEGVGLEVVDTHGGECFGLGALLTNAAPSFTGNTIGDVGRGGDGAGPVTAMAAGIMAIDNQGGAPLVAGNTVRNAAGVGIWDVTALTATPAVVIVGNTVANCPVGIESGSWGPPKSGTLVRSNRIGQDGPLGGGKACILQKNVDTCFIGLNDLSGAFTAGIRLENCHDGFVVGNVAAALVVPSGTPVCVEAEGSSGNQIRQR